MLGPPQGERMHQGAGREQQKPALVSRKAAALLQPPPPAAAAAEQLGAHQLPETATSSPS